MRNPSIRWKLLVLNASWALSIGLPLCANSANLIDETHGAGAGSFELGAFVDGGGNPNVAGAGYMGLLPGDATTLTGWTVGGPGDGIDWLLAPLYRASAGIHAVDLQHLSKSSIATVIPTVVGSQYLLSFSVAALNGADATGSFSAGTLLDQSFTASFSNSSSVQSFTAVAAVFTATSITTTLSFAAIGPTLPLCAAVINCYGPVIDDVSVTPVPEPGTALLLSMGALATLRLGTRPRRSITTMG